jgi:Holliday junction resolvase
MEITLTIPGVPTPQARPRFFRRGDHVGTYKTEKQNAAENCFIARAKSQLIGTPAPIERGVPLAVKCWFVMPVPKSSTKKFRDRCRSEPVYHTKKPDADNLVKFVKDCLNGTAWHDDAQVAQIHGVKIYGAEPRTIVQIQVLEDAA